MDWIKGDKMEGELLVRRTGSDGINLFVYEIRTKRTPEGASAGNTERVYALSPSTFIPADGNDWKAAIKRDKVDLERIIRLANGVEIQGDSSGEIKHVREAYTTRAGGFADAIFAYVHREGDAVVYKKWGGNEVKIGDTEYQFLKFEDILAIIK